MRKRMGIKKSLCSMVLLLSILQSTLIYAEERVYGISDYGPVSVNGNGVGRGKDSTYQYIEDLLYNNHGIPGQETVDLQIPAEAVRQPIRPVPPLKIQRRVAAKIRLLLRKESGIWQSSRGMGKPSLSAQR